MISCISVENMRCSDAHTIATLVPGRELMYRAALGIFKAADWSGRTAIVVGSGNNGGDGFALACILHAHDFSCTVFTVSQKMSDDGAYYGQMAHNAGVSILPYESGCLSGFNRIVDCLLGTGFQGDVRGVYRTAIEEINRSGAFIVSADINSGMNGDTGEAELAVRSHLTVTIGYVKTGLIVPNAGNYIQKLVCTDIGILLLREEAWIYGPEEAPVPNGYPCPPWLDMQVIPSLSA